jgi:hypothetical protein
MWLLEELDFVTTLEFRRYMETIYSRQLTTQELKSLYKQMRDAYIQDHLLEMHAIFLQQLKYKTGG